MAIKVPPKSITYIVICCSVIIILLLIGIYPLHRAMANRDEKIADNNLKLEEQKLLLPVYQMLKQRLEKKSARTLPLPVKAQLPRDQMGRLDADLKLISDQARVDLVSFTPILTSADGKSKTIVVDAVARGELFTMRKFLIGLGSIPYVEHIEEVQLSRTPDWLEIKVKFWVARS